MSQRLLYWNQKLIVLIRQEMDIVTKIKIPMILSVLLVGSIIGNIMQYQRMQVMSEKASSLESQVQALTDENENSKQRLKAQQQSINDLKKQIADAEKTVNELKSEVQAAAAAAAVEPAPTPTAETPSKPSGQLDYSKMSQQEKEARALAAAMGMSYEDLINPKPPTNPSQSDGYQGDVSRETAGWETRHDPAPNAHW